MTRPRSIALLLLLLGLSFLCGYAYYSQHAKWRDCFNEMGRCFDAETGTVYLAQSGQVWLFLALSTFGAFLFQAWRHIRKR